MNQVATTNQSTSRRARLADYLGLEHNVTIASGAVFLLGFGEELWKKFVPKYLETLGATTPIIGLFGTAEDFFDAIYQYPGGFLADRLGRRRAFLIFIALASRGYLGYLISSSWPFLVVALSLAMCGQSMASAAHFAIIGDSLPPELPAMAFTLHCILKLFPPVVSPIIEAPNSVFGIVRGIHIGL